MLGFYRQTLDVGFIRPMRTLLDQVYTRYFRTYIPYSDMKLFVNVQDLLLTTVYREVGGVSKIAL